MRVYRNNKQSFGTSTFFPMYKGENGKYYAMSGKLALVQPKRGLIVETCASFVEVTKDSVTVSPGKYYRMAGFKGSTNTIKWEEVTAKTASGNSVISVFDIMEATYSGKDMGERSVTATIKFNSPIDFQIGDYIELEMQDLRRYNDEYNNGSVQAERFYIYTEPTCKKTARPMSAGDAFETTVKFYPPQYELGCIQMRDFIQAKANADALIYTGFDNVTFYGGAKELLDRCISCLAEQYMDNDGNPLWNYQLADSVNEEKNTALERYAFSFKGNSVMEAIMKLNDTEGINTTFFINGRTIYVGFKRPYLCQVNSRGSITHDIYKLMYGKTSHLPINIDHGGLFDITKSVSEEVPVTKLFAYGAARNLNRYYCSDRIKSGRFVNHLMLPSFSDDGRTDYILSENGVEKYGIREGSKEFEEIYPSLRYMTYADIRGVKYCIKIKTNGLSVELTPGEYQKHINEGSYPIARLQCYRVDPCTGVGDNGGTVGVNKLTECAPPDDIAVFVHAQGKVVKCIIYGDDGQQSQTTGMPRSVERQLAHDVKVPTRTAGGTDYIPGACFAIHDIGWADMDGTTHTSEERASWFTYSSEQTPQTALLHRIEYTDTFWITDLYVFQSYTQEYFQRDGYSAWAWPRLNNDSGFGDSLSVNDIIAVEPITIVDTAFNEFSRQHTFDIYIRDLGFKIDEQDDFGEMVFIFDNITTSFLDGLLAGREFHIAGSINDHQDSCVCAYNEDGSVNPRFSEHNPTLAAEAKLKGAIWRLTLKRQEDNEIQDIGLIVPTKDICAKEDDHFVLLDIYMPDIYIRAAENRLLKEAQRYLDRNDKGNAEYAVSLDKVRMLQVPNLAMQMREGVMLRLVDDDLNILSPNKTRSLFDNRTSYQVPLYTIEQNVSWENKTCDSDYFTGTETGPDGTYIVSKDNATKTCVIAVPRTAESDYESGSAKLFYTTGPTSYGSWKELDVEVTAVTAASTGWLIGVKASEEDYTIITVRTGFKKYVRYVEKIPTQNTNKYNNKGKRIYAMCDTLIDFLGGKYYEVELRLERKFTKSTPTTVDIPEIILSPSKNVDAAKYIPNYSEEHSADSDYITVKYIFSLDESFNDGAPYYISVPYIADGETEYGTIELLSVVEKDIDETGSVTKYADFTAESVTVEISDNTRPASSRILGVYPQPSRELSATLKERSHASSWASLQQAVDNTRIEVSMNQKTVEFLMNEARQNYQTLLTLRNSIFDPDTDTNSKCDYNFLHVMMLQVGADSMNYQLDKTFMTPTGVMNNFNVTAKTQQANGVFSVNQEDRLHHFVYTQGSQGGNWVIPGLFSKELVPVVPEESERESENNEVELTWPVYYVCIRCKKDGQNSQNEVAWICSTGQYAVNQAVDPITGSITNEYNERVDSYWYFNWGILTCPNNDGNYVLSETRGNAYMYGDNIIAGKISTIAGNSYFDLTHGNFVLSQGTEQNAALSYIDGVLTIAGINDGTADSVLGRLGLLEQNEIGGTNLCILPYGKYQRDDTFENTTSQAVTNYIELLPENGQGGHVLVAEGSYVFSAKEISALIYNSIGVPSSEHRVVMVLEAVSLTGVHKYVNLSNGSGIKHVVEITEPCSFRIKYQYLVTSGERIVVDLEGVMLQRGTKETAYQEYVQHITDALQGSTQVAGGLTMTNLLQLRDEDKNVIAGMSGLTDNGEHEVEIGGYTTTVNSEGVAMWCGGNYEQALEQAMSLINLLPVLITKTGINSRIGCFKVIGKETVAIYNEAEDYRIRMSSGQDMSIRMQHLESGEWVDKLIISDESVDVKYQFFTLGAAPYCPKLKQQGSAFTTDEFFIKFLSDNGGYIDRISVPAGCTCNISSSHKMYLSIRTSMSSWKMNHVYLYATVELGRIDNGVFTRVEGAITTFNGVQESVINDNVVEWGLTLSGFTGTPYSIQTAGQYGLRLKIDHFARENGAGITYEEHLYNSNWEDCEIGVSVYQNISFMKNTSLDRTLMKIGNDGILIAHSASSYFLAKNNSSDMDVQISGLPTQQDPAKPNSLYVQSGHLMIN